MPWMHQPGWAESDPHQNDVHHEHLSLVGIDETSTNTTSNATPVSAPAVFLGGSTGMYSSSTPSESIPSLMRNVRHGDVSGRIDSCQFDLTGDAAAVKGTTESDRRRERDQENVEDSFRCLPPQRFHDLDSLSNVDDVPSEWCCITGSLNALYNVYGTARTNAHTTLEYNENTESSSSITSPTHTSLHENAMLFDMSDFTLLDGEMTTSMSPGNQHHDSYPWPRSLRSHQSQNPQTDYNLHQHPLHEPYQACHREEKESNSSHIDSMKSFYSHAFIDNDFNRTDNARNARLKNKRPQFSEKRESSINSGHIEEFFYSLQDMDHSSTNTASFDNTAPGNPKERRGPLSSHIALFDFLANNRQSSKAREERGHFLKTVFSNLKRMVPDETSRRLVAENTAGTTRETNPHVLSKQETEVRVSQSEHPRTEHETKPQIPLTIMPFVSQQVLSPTSRATDSVTSSLRFKPAASKPHALPPCRVCGDKASGVHFGVNSCEACNEFYRRTLRRADNFKCPRGGICDVSGKRRNLCASCRYQKCVTSGMSKERIKTGRYSHIKKLQDKIEIIELQEANKLTDEDLNMENAISRLSALFGRHYHLFLNFQDDVLTSMRLEYYRYYTYSWIRSCNHGDQPVARCGIRCRATRSCWARYRSDSEKLMLSHWDTWLMAFVSIVRQIPGFDILRPDDLARLLKSSLEQVFILTDYRGYDSNLQVQVQATGCVFHFEELVKMFGRDCCETLFRLSDKLKKLRVSKTVILLMMVLVITSSLDDTELSDRDAVENLNWFYVQCLQHELSKRPGSGQPHRTDQHRWRDFAKVVDAIVELRMLSKFTGSAHFTELVKKKIKHGHWMVRLMHEVVF